MEATLRNVPGWQKALASLAASYVGWKVVDGRYNISADVDTLRALVPLVSSVMKAARQPGANVIKDLWYGTLNQSGQKTKVMCVDASTGNALTYGEMEELSNRISHWAVSHGIMPGSSVALMMDNRPEYIATWLGLVKAGIQVAFINTSIKGQPLIHSLAVANCTIAVIGTEHAEVIGAVAEGLQKRGIHLIASYGAGSPAGVSMPSCCQVSLDEVLSTFPTGPVDESLRKNVKVSSTIYYIYTSGTTGLPKACNISHLKFFALSMVLRFFQVKPDDVIYGSGMPLYHSAANLGVTCCFAQGNTYITRPKFSATNHWKDCAQYGATVMQYIGELCRYLISASPAGNDTVHKVRIALGNGLRPEIWDQFQRRFNIPEIGEFYGATEGNGSTLNHCRNYQGQGAIGRMGSLLLKARPMKIVKFDVTNEAPYRNPEGFCVECGPNEPGELLTPISKVPTADGYVDDFEGYTSQDATEKKVLRDVFKKGDRYFRSGDLLRRDRQGYYYFVDRIGDTFRWKGENVSTMEVSEVLSSFPAIVDANVYGVQVPGKDGRACMVAITLHPGMTLDPDQFATFCRANLPSYSIPLFVRFINEDINLTGTLKHQKVQYRDNGCDPSKVTDTMWWYNAPSGTFEPYGAKQYNDIIAGRSKL